jgi:HEAT repeat protein
LTALDCLEVLDPGPFVTAVRYRQLEPAMGGSVDTAGGVRVRSVLALLRMVHADAALLAGELMADSDPQVRASVARGLGHYADRSLAALLTYKLHCGDEDPVVLAECATSLLAVAGPYGVDRVASLLSGDDEILRETAALALGQSRDSAALARLLAWVEQSAFDRDFKLGIRALGLSRHEAARQYLLGLVAEGSQARAAAAVEALAVHAYDETLRARVQRAADKNPRARLVEVVRRLFGPTAD